MEKVRFEVNTVERFDVDVEGYKFYKNLSLEEARELVNRLLKEMTEGKIACFNVALAEKAV